MHVGQDEENDGLNALGWTGRTEDQPTKPSPLAHLHCLQPFAFHPHCYDRCFLIYTQAPLLVAL